MKNEREQSLLSEGNLSQNAPMLFNTLFSTLPIPMIFVNTEEKILFVNSAYTIYLKTKVSDVIGKHVKEFIPNSRIPTVLKTRKPEFSNYHRYVEGPADGQEAIVHRIPIEDVNGELIGCLGMVIFQNLNDLLDLTVKNKKLKDELEFYKGELKQLQNTKYTIDNILGKSAAIKEMKEKILKFSQGSSNILISGESGSGKELVAHSLHNSSPRSIHPLSLIHISFFQTTAIPLRTINTTINPYTAFCLPYGVY